MNRLRNLALSVLLVLAMTTSALAANVPNDLVVENVNGQQRMVKTYVVPPDVDPKSLEEPPFEYGGFTYTWAYTTKEEHTVSESKEATETVTVETAKKDLAVVLEQLAPSIPYNDGTFSGELVLDHTSLSTVAAGYATRSGTVTTTKTIGPLDRNDMSYVPSTTVKDGVTLTLSGVTWQVVGSDEVGGIMMPASYQAVATYSASTSYRVATGYVTTAKYIGTVTASGVDSITYTVVYEGEEVVPDPPAESPEPVEGLKVPPFHGGAATIGGFLVAALLASLAGIGVYLFLHRKNVYVYVPGDKPRDYKLVAKFRVEVQRPEIDITTLDPYPEGVVAVEIKRPLATKLLGQTFTVRNWRSDYTYTVLRDRPGDWHEFNASEEKEGSI